MKVTVSVHGRFHAFELADGLHRLGHLDRLLTTYPAFAVRRFVDAGVRLRTAPWLEVRRRLHDATGLGAKPDFAIARAFGRFAAGALEPGADVLVGWSSATLEVIPVARDLGMKVVVERGSTHIAHQWEVLRDAYGRFGLPFDDADPRIVERETAEYEAADAIAVPSRFAAATFVARGVPENRLIVNPYGVDLGRFSPAPPPATGGGRRPRVLFVGRVGLRKGVPTLLEAFAGLGGAAELHIVGPLENGIKEMLGRRPLDGVTVRGAVAGDALPAEYAAADVFCLPSIEEGFPLVLLQAMACGLPVVATDATGIGDVLTPGLEGLIVPAGDAAALRDALTGLTADADKRLAMGRAAAERVRSGLGWADYVDRAVAAYNALSA